MSKADNILGPIQSYRLSTASASLELSVVHVDVLVLRNGKQYTETVIGGSDPEYVAYDDDARLRLVK